MSNKLVASVTVEFYENDRQSPIYPPELAVVATHVATALQSINIWNDTAEGIDTKLALTKCKVVNVTVMGSAD